MNNAPLNPPTATSTSNATASMLWPTPTGTCGSGHDQGNPIDTGWSKGTTYCSVDWPSFLGNLSTSPCCLNDLNHWAAGTSIFWNCTQVCRSNLTSEEFNSCLTIHVLPGYPGFLQADCDTISASSTFTRPGSVSVASVVVISLLASTWFA